MEILPTKHKDLKGNVAFWRNTERSGFVEVNKVEKGAPAWDQGRYQLAINTGQHLETTYFSDKHQAMVWAKDWMEQNPEG